MRINCPFTSFFFKSIIFELDGAWGDWTAWSSCSKTCGEGTESRSRNCDSPAAAHGGKECAGKGTDQKDCTVGK